MANSFRSLSESLLTIVNPAIQIRITTESKEIVLNVLKNNGYTLKTINLGIPYTDDWIFAERD